MTFLKNHAKNIGALLLLCILGGIYSIFDGQDCGWDLLNYHLYNPFAFLTGRWGYDIIPAGIHTFLNPLLDIPYYLLIKYLNDYPRLVAFLAGFPAGVLWFTGYKIARIFFPNQEDKIWAFLATLTGLTGTMTLSQIGFDSNEITVAALIGVATYGLFRFLFQAPQKRIWLFASAFIAGATVGLKYTAAPFVIGLTVVFFTNLPRQEKRLKNTLLFAGGGILGFLITNGYFVWHLWTTYHNPVFPFFNSIFQSEFFEPHNFDETRFYPRNFLQWIAYPFVWAVKVKGIVAEVDMADPRWAIGYICFLFLTIWTGLRRNLPTDRRLLISTLIFTAVTYVIWLHIYSVLRYVVLLELFCGIFMVLFLRYLFSPRTTLVTGLAILLCVVNLTYIPEWGKIGFGKKAIVLNEFEQEEPNALVVYFGMPMAYLTLYFRPETKTIGGIHFPIEKYPVALQRKARQRNSLPDAYYGLKFDKQILQTIEQHEGPIYIVAVPWEMMLDPITLAPYGLDGEGASCIAFNANINQYSNEYNLCKVRKLSAAKK